MGDKALRGNKLTRGRGPHGHAHQPHLSVHAKGGRIGRPSKRKDFKTHGRDIPTMAAKGGRIGLRFGSGRTNLLEQLGRVEAERSNPNRRAEISRVHGELNRGYAIGGVVKKAIKKLRPAGPFKPKKKAFKTHGKDVPTMAAEGGRIGLKKGEKVSEKSTHSRISGYKPHPHGTHSPGNIKALRKAWGRTQDKKPHSTAEGRHATSSRKFGRVLKEAAGMKKGGKADKNWIQKATASIKKRGTKGKCTPITKKGCTGRAKALAKTFKKMAAKRKT